MERLTQRLDDVRASLSPLPADWQDGTAVEVVKKLAAFPAKPRYDNADLLNLLDGHFDHGLLVCQLFLGISKDEFFNSLAQKLGGRAGGIGIKRFQRDRATYVEALAQLGLLEAMAAQVNRQPVWSDVLVERLRSGRGRAIAGQQRGRGLEDFVEAIVKEVFGAGGYQARVTFVGADGRAREKCDFAIPSRDNPMIVIEVKGYGATGSKMTDIIGDLTRIVATKRHDTTMLFVTDGVTWNQRIADLAKIVQMQNVGQIARIYTTKMAEQLTRDLHQLKQEYRIGDGLA